MISGVDVTGANMQVFKDKMAMIVAKELNIVATNVVIVSVTTLLGAGGAVSVLGGGGAVSVVYTATVNDAFAAAATLAVAVATKAFTADLHAAGYPGASASTMPSVVQTTASPTGNPVTAPTTSSSSRLYTTVISYLSLFCFLLF
jgi:hypothetical protein